MEPSEVLDSRTKRVRSLMHIRLSEQVLGRMRAVTIFAGSVVLGLAAWQVVASLFFNPYVLPPPTRVFQSAWETAASGELPAMVGISLIRICVGFVLGSVAGIALGLMMGQSRIIGEFFDPLVELIRPISPVAMIPIAIVWFGIGEASKYFIIAYGVFFVTLLNTIAGVRHTPAVRKRAAMCLGAGRWTMFVRVILPSAVPYINTGMRVALGGAFMSVIAAEMIAANEGIGYFIMQARLLVQTQRIFVGLVTLGVMGFLTDRVYRILVALLLGKYLRVDR